MAQILDIDSFLNSFRCFIARRGAPEQMRSDNGGNFVSREGELRRYIDTWKQSQIADFLLKSNVQWIFNPPGGSHHGGIWERYIPTVRKVLNLPSVQERQKWTRPVRNFQVGDIVLVVDEKTPRGLWPLARIVDVRKNQRE